MVSAIRYIISLSAFALFVTLMPLTSCDDTSEMRSAGDDGKYQAVFTINMGSQSVPSWHNTPTDGTYDAGTPLENYIDIPGMDYRCYLFGIDNRLVSPLTVVRMLSLNDPEARTYTVVTQLDDNEAVKAAIKNGCRFVFLANWGSYPEVTTGVTTIEDICTGVAARLDFDEERSILSQENLIPLYGVKEFSDGVPVSPENENKYDIGTLHLLRAFAKIEVCTTLTDFPENSEVNVTSVELTHCSARAFKAPANVIREDQYITGSWHTDYTPINIPSESSSQKLALRKTADNRFLAYVPEFRNLAADGTPLPVDDRARLKVTFECDGAAETGYVDFCYTEQPSDQNVNPGVYFNIARNTWYRFNVNITSHGLEWTADVQPYALAELAPGFGLERDDEGNIIIRDLKGKIIRVITVDGRDIKGEDFKFGNVSGSNLTYEGKVLYRFYDDGRTQRFYEDGSWDMLSAEGMLLSTFMMTTPDSNGSTGTGIWSKFDPYGILIERYNDTKLLSDLMTCQGGTQDVDYDELKNGSKNVKYYIDGEWVYSVHLEVVLHFDGTVANAINAPYFQKIEQKEVELERTVDGEQVIQKAREVYIDNELRYRYFEDKSYQNLYNDGAFDTFDSDGIKRSSYITHDKNFNDKSSYTIYDRWNHSIERWTEAVPDEHQLSASYDEANKVIKYELVSPRPENKKATFMMIFYRKSGTWVRIYDINQLGEIVTAY